MHIRKFTQDYTRRYFLESMARGAVGAGVLMPLWDAISNSGDIRAAYPDEALELETYSKGAVKAGDQITAANVDAVKDLLDPIAYIQIKEQGRVVDTRPITTDIRELNPLPYTEATIENQGLAQFDAKGNVVTPEGKPWIGGNPFPKAETAEQILAGHVLSWGRLDQVMYPVYEWDLDADGNQQYHYQFVWIEYATVARTVMEPKPYMPGHEDKLRYNTVLFTYPGDVSGTSLLNVWAYDQTKFPDFNGYMPAFKRVRRFPTNQRFEPIIPGSTFFISDAWMMGDPYMTWGNFKFVGKAPLLANVSHNWNADDPNWLIPRVGGKSGKKFFQTTMELVPETLIVDLEPTGYPRAPYSKKRIWFDARTLTPLVHITYDRRGQIWKQWEGGFARFQTADGRQWPESGEPYWSFCIVHSHDIQSDYMSLLQQVRQVEGGLSVRFNDPTVYENFCTIEAIRRLGT